MLNAVGSCPSESTPSKIILAFRVGLGLGLVLGFGKVIALRLRLGLALGFGKVIDLRLGLGLVLVLGKVIALLLLLVFVLGLELSF